MEASAETRPGWVETALFGLVIALALLLPLALRQAQAAGGCEVVVLATPFRPLDRSTSSGLTAQEAGHGR